MIIRTADSIPLNAPASGPAVTAALVVVLFVAILLHWLLIPLRYAHGLTEVFSARTTVAAPMAANGIVEIVFGAITTIVVVSIDLRQLAR
jgi:hypothetical protein